MWELIRAVHLLAMAFFVGGQLLLAVAVVPVERGAPAPERMRSMARRFGWGTLVAIGVLLATGAAMATEFHQWGNGTLQVKLGLVVAVAGLIALHLRRPDLRVLDGAIFATSLATVWLGVSLAH
jgi:putative copper export protein